jgi:hypothetical protein
MINGLLSELKFAILYNYLDKAKDDVVFSPVYLLGIGDWCGQGTDILESIIRTDGTETYKMDKICRKHDLAYLNSKSRFEIHNADANMLGDILDEFTIKGVKQGINNILGGKSLPIAEFGKYIFNLIYDAITNPIQTITKELGGKGLLVNYLGLKRAFKYIALNPEISMSNIASDMMLVRERVLAILGFGAIGMKLLYDISIGKATDTVTGYEDTKFDINEIAHILFEIEAIQNDRLASAGYDNIDMADILSRSVDDIINEVEEIDEPEDITITEAKNILNSLTEEDEQYISDLMNEYEVGENEIDETNIAEQTIDESNTGEIIL